MISIKRIPQDPFFEPPGDPYQLHQPHTPRYVGKEDGSVEPQKIHTVVISTQHAEPSKAVRSKVRSFQADGKGWWQWMRLVEVGAWWVPVSLGGKNPEGYGSRFCVFRGNGKFGACGVFVSHVFFNQVFCWLPSQVVFVLFLEDKCKKRYSMRIMRLVVSIVECSNGCYSIYIYTCTSRNYDCIPSLQWKLRADFVRSALATRAQRWLLPAWPTWTRHPEERS